MGSLRVRHDLATVQQQKLIFPDGSDDKECTCNAGDVSLIPGLGRYPGEWHGNPLQYSYLGNHGQMSLGDYSPWDHIRIGHELATKQQI